MGRQQGSRSSWWVLLILPAALLGGLIVGGLPTAKSPEPGPQANRAAATAMDVEPPQAVAGIAGSASAPPTEPRAEISRWTTIDDALEESKRNGKPVLLDFNAEWCGPCRMMKQDVFDNWERGQAVQTVVIPVSVVDRQREEGRNSSQVESLQERYQVVAFPTLIVYSPATGRTMSSRGYGGPERTVRWIAEAAKSVSAR